jgi:hypothetical protein
VADAFDGLLDYIVRELVVPDAQKDVDLNATAEETADDIIATKEQKTAGAVDRARALSTPFREGLVLAFEAQQIGHHEIRLDDRDPTQNAIADALIAYLVGFELAESRSEETEPGHYLYFLSVDWDRLYEVAERAGVNLPAALADAASIPPA